MNAIESAAAMLDADETSRSRSLAAALRELDRRTAPTPPRRAVRQRGGARRRGGRAGRGDGGGAGNG